MAAQIFEEPPVKGIAKISIKLLMLSIYTTALVYIVDRELSWETGMVPIKVWLFIAMFIFLSHSLTDTDFTFCASLIDSMDC